MTSTQVNDLYKRVVLKISGESLLGGLSFGIDAHKLTSIAKEVSILRENNIEVIVVIGGGNIFRGVQLSTIGISRVIADQMGMLATVINALALDESFKKISIPSRVLSSIGIHEMCDTYSQRHALRCLANGEIVICAAGTGNPFFTTDSAASLRAIELQADIMLKATNVDGVYSADPKINKNAKIFSKVSYDYVIEHKLSALDSTAVVMCRDYKIPVKVFNIHFPNHIYQAVFNKNFGTLIGDFNEPAI
ncbi:MAG: UMP kinase [Methylacidiphilales bacterium]|nr:UMP kinase [Candidatus Methylacidiphilales bacterium]